MITHSARQSFLIIQNHKCPFIRAINLPTGTASKSHSNVKLLWHVLYDMHPCCILVASQLTLFVFLFGGPEQENHTNQHIVREQRQIDGQIPAAASQPYPLFVNLLISFALPNPCKGMNDMVWEWSVLDNVCDFVSNPFFLRQRFESMPIKGDYAMSPYILRKIKFNRLQERLLL